MSPKNPPNIVGLAAPGLLWLATSVAFGQDPPPAPPGRPSPAPAPPSPNSKAYRVLLLTNGKVVSGEITEDASAGLYRLRQNGGMVGYPRIMVLTAGETLEDLYRFQVARLPSGDPDEQMKLARWCLTQHLTAQAKEQLEAIRAMCPDDAEVKRMLYNLATTGDRPPVDGGVRLTSGEMPRGEAPASLDPKVIFRAQKRFNALPEIFDLPQAQAVKRANEFADYVQPVLQQSCAKCHNEKYQGDFQLVEIKIRRDQTNPDIARANLDATLRLINPDDPARSALLSAGLVPHGGSRNAVFRGPNDRSYQVLSQWTRSLRPTKGATAGQAGSKGFGDGLPRSGSAQDEGFASERSGRTSSLPEFPSKLEASVPPIPPQGSVERYNESAEFLNAPGDKPEFPSPFVVGGAPASRPAPPKKKAAGPKAPAPSGTPSGAPSAPAVSKKTATPAGPGSVVVTTEDRSELPGMDLPRYPPKPETADEDDEADKVKPKKPKPIDNAQLEKVLRNRNGGGTP